MNSFSLKACSLAWCLIFTSNVNWTCSPEWAHGIQYCMKTYCFLWCLSSWHSPTHGCRHVADGCMTPLWWSNISIAWKYGFIIKVLFANNLKKEGVLNIILEIEQIQFVKLSSINKQFWTLKYSKASEWSIFMVVEPKRKMFMFMAWIDPIKFWKWS